MNVPPLAWLGLGALVAFVVLVFYLSVSTKRDLARALAALAAAKCPRCSSAFTAAAAEAGYRANMERKQAALADARSKGLMRRLDPRWHFDCPSCGGELRFDPQARVFS